MFYENFAAKNIVVDSEHTVDFYGQTLLLILLQRLISYRIICIGLDISYSKSSLIEHN